MFFCSAPDAELPVSDQKPQPLDSHSPGLSQSHVAKTPLKELDLNSNSYNSQPTIKKPRQTKNQSTQDLALFPGKDWAIPGLLSSTSLNGPYTSPTDENVCPELSILSQLLHYPNPPPSKPSTKNYGFFDSSNTQISQFYQKKAYLEKKKTPETSSENSFDISVQRIRSGLETRTTVMIKNIPNKYDQKIF
jgi:hypothetical protein